MIGKASASSAISFPEAGVILAPEVASSMLMPMTMPSMVRVDRSLSL